MIRVRRVPSSTPLVKRYELQFRSIGQDGEIADDLTLRRGMAVRRLERVIGVGDAWSFLHEADRQWAAGNRGWAVEFEEGGFGS
jgi:hypothetical protein